MALLDDNSHTNISDAVVLGVAAACAGAGVADKDGELFTVEVDAQLLEDLVHVGRGDQRAAAARHGPACTDAEAEEKLSKLCAMLNLVRVGVLIAHPAREYVFSVNELIYASQLAAQARAERAIVAAIEGLGARLELSLIHISEPTRPY